MTPYRVLVRDPFIEVPTLTNSTNSCVNPQNLVYAAMLSKSKITGLNRIYIVYKPIPLGYEGQYKEIAHKMSAPYNCQIMKVYEIEEVQTNSRRAKYGVLECEKSNDIRPVFVGDLQYTLHDCLVLAMHHYIYEHQLELLCQL